MTNVYRPIIEGVARVEVQVRQIAEDGTPGPETQSSVSPVTMALLLTETEENTE